MIEVWIGSYSELVVPPNAGKSYFGYEIKKNGEKVYDNCGPVGKVKDITKDVGVYTSLIDALKKIKRRGLSGEKIVIKSDSKSLVRQMTVQKTVRTEELKPLFYKAKILVSPLDISFEKVARWKNKEANEWAYIARQREDYVQI